MGRRTGCSRTFTGKVVSQTRRASTGGVAATPTEQTAPTRETPMSPPANSGRRILPWLAVLGGIGFLTAGAAVAGLILDRSGEERRDVSPPVEHRRADAAPLPVALDEQIHQAGTACHAYPPPRPFPR